MHNANKVFVTDYKNRTPSVSAEPPIERTLKHHYADYKTIFSPQNGMNIYRGCTHGCIYCDSRSACYQMKHDFEDIEVKRKVIP